MPLKTYEQPLNERMRTCLRLEHLFQRGDIFLRGDDARESLSALLALLELHDLLTRVDFKRELMKELERQHAILARLLDAPDVDSGKLQMLLRRQKDLIDRLHAHAGQIGSHLKQHDMLSAIKQRSNIPGGLCDFDIPALHYWLKLDPELRRSDLQGWLQPFQLIRESLELILEVVRNSVGPMRIRAERGFLNQSLEPGVSYQMVRVFIGDETPYFPVISGGRQSFSVRFLALDPREGRSAQTQNDVEFHLACCAL